MREELDVPRDCDMVADRHQEGFRPEGASVDAEKPTIFADRDTQASGERHRVASQEGLGAQASEDPFQHSSPKDFDANMAA
ncbi:hypothetical protein [Nocardioides sp. AE5]|uniref:hypothetical protein n=1 Tax=Nocardioides sp. AE5 TaxID=2962573 RepID=UPI002881CF5F|nr:hypothetical protein [Nocardioides sp. AE5]MDT0202637.1 hypothetical protein [Nocardioides sp. AE5]